jgi:malate dehydrogenase (oxaloacetate-decarboxylating)
MFPSAASIPVKIPGCRAHERTVLSQDGSGDEASRKAIKYSAFYKGKISVSPKVPVRSLDDFSIWYTPGVAAVSREIARDAELSYEYTNRWNTVGVITDGSRVLGLGNVGPEASLPVMEGKALIYKYLGGVDAIPIPLRIADADEYVRTVKALEPALGAVNLEDTESPKCFEILERLQKEMNIPVWHDDQQGTAGVILAALLNALEFTGRNLRDASIVFLGSGAANVAAVRLLKVAGADPKNIVVVDSKGILNPERADMDQLFLHNRWKYDIALETNGERLEGGLSEALKGKDALIAASHPGPGVVSRAQVASMGKRSIVFLLANPVPEMWPDDAKAAGAEVIATGRSDFPNQVNNSLMFPAVLRGALDVRAKTITDTTVVAAATELAAFARERGLSSTNIIPTMVDWEVYPRVAAAVGEAAQKEGVARKSESKADLLATAREIIEGARKDLKLLVDSGLIRSPPQ